MRFHFPNMTRPKRAARALSAVVGTVSLSAAQAAVARACGYRDWRDLDRHHASASATPDLGEDALLATAPALILELSHALGVDDGSVQYAISASRLLRSGAWTLEEHVAVRAGCWRRGVMPFGAEPGPGTVVRVPREHGSVGYVAGEEGVTGMVWTDRGKTLLCARHEITVPRNRLPDFVPPRLYLAYGRWEMPDGSHVLFSRDYIPMWRVAEGMAAQRLPCDVFIRGIMRTEWFWLDHTDPHDSERDMRLHHANLEALGISGLPSLVDRIPHLVRSFENASRMERARDPSKGPQLGFPYDARAPRLSPRHPIVRAIHVKDEPDFRDEAREYLDATLH